MQRFNTSLKPIRPVTLAMQSQRLRPRFRGLSGFFDDIDMGSWLDTGKKELSKFITQAANGDSNAHINAQNRAGADMDLIQQQYTAYKNAGTLTVDLINRAEAAYRGVMGNFRNYASQIGSQRALQGARDIDYYGNLAISAMEQDRANLTGGLYVPGPTGGSVTGGGGFPGFPSLTSVQSVLPFALAGVFLFMLPKAFKKPGTRRRRRR